MLRKLGFYLLFASFVFSGQFLLTGDLITGRPPLIQQSTLYGIPAMQLIEQGPAIIYFWAEWCGICGMMQNSMSVLAAEYPQLSIALRSGSDDEVKRYLQKNHLPFSVVNDQYGNIAKKFGVRAVPALFFVNKNGNIVFTSSGYSTEWGLRLRIWLTSLI